MPQLQSPENVWAIANGKGGVGKTTVAATLAQLAAADGRRVLVVDLDPQGTMAYDLGYPADTEGGVELFDAVARRRRLQPTFRDVRPGLDVVAAGNDTHALGVWLASQPRGDANAPYRLAQAVGAVAPDYDLVLIDCPPGERALQEAALVSSRWLLIPTNADAGSQAGLQQMAARFKTALEANPRPWASWSRPHLRARVGRRDTRSGTDRDHSGVRRRWWILVSVGHPSRGQTCGHSPWTRDHRA